MLSDIQILIAPWVSFGHCVVWYTYSDCPFGIFWSLCCLIYRIWLPFGIFWSLCCLIYRFWLPLWYLLVIVLSDIQILIAPLVSFGHCVVWYADSDCPFDIFWPLYCLLYRFWLPLWYLLVIVLSDIQILIAPLVSFSHCIVCYTDSDCPFGIFWSLCCLIYRLWLSLWYLLVIVLSDIQILISPLLSFSHCVFWYTDSDFPFGIFWSLCCLIYIFWLPLWYLLVTVLSDIQILITPLVSFGHCVVWYTDSDYPLVSFGHCVVWYTDSDCPFGIFWSLCCLIYRFWLSLWYLLVIVLSDIQILFVPLVSFGHCVVWYTDSDCPLGIFWSLCCLIYRFWLPLWYILSLCCLIYRFWLPLWYLLVIVLSDIQILITPLVSFGHCVVWYTDSEYPFGIFWSLCCLIYIFWLPFGFFWSLCCLIYRFWLPLWYLLVTVLSDIQILIVPWYLLVIVLSDIQILIALLVSFGHCVAWYTDSDYPFGIFWSLCCLIYRFWLPFGFFWSLCCLIYRFWLLLLYLLVTVLSDIQILIVPLVSFGHCVVWYTDSDCPFGIFWSLCCLIYRFWLSLWYLLVTVLSDIQISFGHCVVWYRDSDYPFGIFWPLCCLLCRFWLPFGFFWSLCCLIYRFWFLLWYLLVIVLSDIQILISPLVSFGHCVVCYWYTDSDFPSGIFWSLCCLIYRFWFPLWYLLAIVLSVIQILVTLWFLLVIVLSDIQILISLLVSFGHCVFWYTDSDCPFGIFWSLCFLIYRFWLPLWYLLVIVLSDIQIMIFPLVSFGHCVVWYTDSDFPSGIFWSLCCLIYRFWFSLWYLLAIVLSVIQILITLWFLLVIVLSDIQILICPLVSFGHCVVCYADSDYIWFLLVIVLSDIQILIAALVSFGHCVVWYTDSDCPFGILWPLYCLLYRFWLLLWYLLVIVLSDIQIMIVPLVSFGHCVVWYTDSDIPFGIFWSLCFLIYRFWFPLWYLLAIMLSVIQILITLWYLLVIVLSDIQILIIPFGFFWSLCCLIYIFWFPLWYLLVIVFSDIQISITLWYLLVIVLYVIQILIAPLVSFGQCVV